MDDAYRMVSLKQGKKEDLEKVEGKEERSNEKKVVITKDSGVFQSTESINFMNQ